MAASAQVTLLSYQGEGWSEVIDRLRSELGSPNNPTLFPPHFLTSTFVKIGGLAIEVKREQDLIGVGFLFPRGWDGTKRAFTLRLHKLAENVDEDEVRRQAAEAIDGGSVVVYDPAGEQHYTPTSHVSGVIDIGGPNQAESIVIRDLQRQIWGSEPDFLYPADIHSQGFQAGTSLIARVDGTPVGFGFGFYKFDGPRLPQTWDERFNGAYRLESQLVGVLPTRRQSGIAFLIKRIQAEQALRDGIGIVNWTVDPLQYANAVLNFGRLRAIAFDFFPDYYSFRNTLNQVSASRFGVTWLIKSSLVRQSLRDQERSNIVSLEDDRSIKRVNRGWADMTLQEDATRIAIEVPRDWTDVQNTDLGVAQRWRITTDRLFQHYLGCDDGKYVVVDIGRDHAGGAYLIAQRVDDAFISQYV